MKLEAKKNSFYFLLETFETFRQKCEQVNIGITCIYIYYIYTIYKLHILYILYILYIQYIFKEILNLNVLVKIYGEKKHNLFKSANIYLLFRRFINVRSNYKLNFYLLSRHALLLLEHFLFYFKVSIFLDDYQF